jgi:hypothetical protein
MDSAFSVIHAAYKKLGATDQVAKGVEFEQAIEK